MLSCQSCTQKDEQLKNLQQEIDALRHHQHQPQQQSQESANITVKNLPANAAIPPSPFLSSQAHLTKAEVERYSRQALLPECGPEGTKAFLDARVVVIGCGGLGSTAILYLAASGIGHLVLVDADVVDRSNLHRQVIHPDDRVGIPKVESAKRSALALNPTIKIDTFQERFTEANALRIMEKATIVLDCSDNVATRYLVNDACVRQGLALVSGAAMRWDGQLSVYNLPLDAMDDNNRSPTYRCMHPEPPPVSTLGGCSDIGVFGPVPGMIGILQALEALKAILHLESLKNISIRERKRHELEKQQNGEVDSDNVHHNHHHVPNNNNSNANNSGMAASIMAGRMLVWDAYMSTFRIMKMRPRSVTGVERAKQGSLSSLGGEYDGCTLEVVSDPEVTVENVEPSEILRQLHLTTKNNDFSEGEEEEEENKSNCISEQQVHSDKRRRQREEENNNKNGKNDHSHDEVKGSHHSVVITAAHVRNQLRDYLHPQEKVMVNINLQHQHHHQFPASSIAKGHPDFCSDSSSTIYMPPAQELLLRQQKQKQEEQEEQKAKEEEIKIQSRQVKLVLFLDVRKTIQQRLCSLDDLYEIPSLNDSCSSNNNIKTLILHLGVPFSELQKKVNNLMNILTEMNNNKNNNDDDDEKNERSSSIEHEISVELFLSELFLIGSSPNKEILQNSQHVRDLLAPENVASVEILCLCRRGIDSAKSVIVLEKLRRAIKQHRDEMIKKNPSLYHHHQNNDQAVGEDDDAATNKKTIFTTCSDLFISDEHFAVKNVKGGLNLWSLKADDHFPYY